VLAGIEDYNFKKMKESENLEDRGTDGNTSEMDLKR